MKTTLNPFRSILTAGTVAAALALGTGVTAAHAGDIQAPCSAPDLSGFHLLAELTPDHIVAHLTYADAADTCEATVLVRTYSLEEPGGSFWDPSTVWGGEDKVSLQTIEDLTTQGGSYTVELPIPGCVPGIHAWIEEQLPGGYEFGDICPDEPDQPDQPDDPQGDVVTGGELPHTGSDSAPLLAVGSVLAGLGAVAVGLSRRRSSAAS